MSTAQEIVKFWIEDTDQSGWYIQSDDLDAEIQRRFRADWDALMQGELRGWWETADGALAFLILADQFSRNLFRDDPRSFASDAAARDCARYVLAHNLDPQIEKPARQFCYTPFLHSENLADQDLNLALQLARMSEDQNAPAVHARAHRLQIVRFGRFPGRNAALGRKSTPQEQAFLDEGGYGSLVQELQQT